MRFPHPGGYGPGDFGGFQMVVTDIVAGLVFIVLLAVAVGLIFLLVRFLIAMTRAAELYVAINRRPVDGSTPAATQPARFPWGDSTDSAATKPTTTAPRTRKPKL